MKEANWYTEREFFLRARDHAWDQNETGSLQGLSTPSTELTKHIDVFQWGNEGRRGSAPLQIRMASRAQPACSSAPKVCAETPLRKNSWAGPLKLRMFSQPAHTSPGTVPCLDSIAGHLHSGQSRWQAWSSKLLFHHYSKDNDRAREADCCWRGERSRN